MRVDDRNLNGATGLQPGRAAETHELDRLAPPGGNAESAGSDRAEISSLAGRISESLAVQNTARAQRIEKLAQDYRTGRYHANPRATSRAIVQEAIGNKDGAQ